MKTGTITYLNSPRGFGFVTTIEGERFFFHISSHFEKGSQPVLEGRVEFEVAPPIAVGKKPMAVNVRYRRAVLGGDQ
jgi:cold shock CspA family protein